MREGRAEAHPPVVSDPGLETRWSEPATEGTRRERALRDLRAGMATDKDLRGIRLIDEDLSGLDLSGFDLSGADLSRCDLRGAQLMGARLRGAVLFGADLSECEFLGADLSGAELSESIAERTGFSDVDLSNAVLFNARLTGASLIRSDLRGADFKAADLQGARLRESKLCEADFSVAKLRGADLEASDVKQARFVDCDLREARLRKIENYVEANWIGADIQNVDFCGAYLIRRAIMDQNYLHEFRNQSRINAGLYWVWWATSDCGRSFVRWGLWTVFLCVVFAGLFERVAVDHGDYPTALSSLYYSLVTLTTLGYGDVVPASLPAQILAMIEVTLGYVMLGGLMSIFANKMARRAD